MNTFLPWIIPPLAGALIGYITNAVAVKMLFRPLGEIRIFGIRLPFTPGVLPRQRHRLADNIGVMVERELLTEDILRARIRREDVRSGFAQSIAVYTAGFLNIPLETHSRLILSLIRNCINSSIPDALIATVPEIMKFPPAMPGRGLMGSSIGEILGAERSAALKQRLDAFLTGEFHRNAEGISAFTAQLLEEIYPGLIGSFIQYLERPSIRKELEIHGHIFFNNAILKLNVLQRFFLSTGQYDKTLHDRMGEIITDLIRHLREILETADIRRRLIMFAGALIQEELSRESAAGTLGKFMEHFIVPLLNRPLGELVVLMHGNDIRPALKDILAWLREKVRDEKTLADAVKKYGKRSLAEILHIAPEKKEKLDLLIRDKLLNLAEEQSGAALKAVNIRTLVSEHIDSMDMLSVERIVLDVMASQLKWINFFGAILGALIGIFQALLSRFF
jgi:uncharacterized membrane protein YheB (UPF0754 family)